MNWKNKKKWQYLSMLLTIALLAGSFFGLKSADTVEPENILLTEAKKITLEAAEKGLQSNERVVQEDEKEESQQEKNQKKELEENKEEQENSEKESEEKQEEETIEKESEEKQEEETSDKEPDNNKKPEKEDSEENKDSEQESDKEQKDEQSGTENEEITGNDDAEDNTDENPAGDENGEEKAGLVTDLQSKIITFSELENNTLNFYAYYSDATVEADIRVNYRYEIENGNGAWLTASGRNYSCGLKLGRNVITIYYNDAAGERKYTSFTITYQADKATEEKNEVGENPPVIITNLDDWTGEIRTQNFTFTVSAKTGAGQQIYSNHLQVQMDGRDITNPTGNSIYEYELYFPKPASGETEIHKITVLAWDDAGNSKQVTYQVTYRFAEEGEVIGQVRVVVDATTVGVGILADEIVDIIQGKPASYTLLAALEQMNFEYEFAGTEMIGFYIRSVTRGNAFKNAAIPENLLEMLQKDEMTMRQPCTRNRLGEYDFTQGSGWLYSVNGGNYAGKGLSEWYLNDGDTLYMRYTLAYGKDIGGSESEFGRLNSYCGMWMDGGYIPLEHTYVETRVEPTENEDGYVEYCCSNCLHSYKEELPHP